jgi:hypothetical protein
MFQAMPDFGPDDMRKLLRGDRTDEELDAQVTAHYSAEQAKLLNKMDIWLERIESRARDIQIACWIGAAAVASIAIKLWLLP